MNNLWVPLSAAIAQQRQVETIANNVANANTPGFKKDQLIFREYLTAVEKGVENVDLPRKEWSPEDFYRSHDAENAYVKIAGSYTIHEQGPITPTGNALDVAIEGPGFFEFLTPNGIRYGRKGIFTISRDGELVNDKGYKVLTRPSVDEQQIKDAASTLNDALDPSKRVIKIENTALTIDRDGTLVQGGRSLGQISVAEFKDPHALLKEGDNMFISTENTNLLFTSQTSKLHQGHVEQSNVNAISEMSSLINANRHFGNIQKAIKTYDAISGRSVNDIARF